MKRNQLIVIYMLTLFNVVSHFDSGNLQ
jgi:hypothetical protein